MNNNTPLIRAEGIRKIYDKETSHPLEILKSLSLEIKAGECVSIIGQSGAGKSTLLHILGSLDVPTEGKVYFEEEDIFAKNPDELAQFRNKTMGFVFQSHHLLPEFTALENVVLPSRIAGLSKKMAEAAAEKLLTDVGLSHRLQHFPSQLSGGERQRVAIARALVRRPRILFADEPTGNLDTENGMKVQNLLFDLHQKYQITLLVVTHDRNFAARFPRQLAMQDGKWLPLMFR